MQLNFASREVALELVYSDTGVGIPASERARAFDAFYQVDSSGTRPFGGAGLGLSTVKRVVEPHGGSMRIESNQPKGSVFVVTLPSRVPPAMAAP